MTKIRKKKNEAYEVLRALHKTPIFVGTDAGNDLWNKIITDLREKENKPRDLEFVSTHPPGWPLLNSERPDVIYEDEQIILGIECFKFDSSRNNRNGSSLLRSQNQLEKELLSKYYSTGETCLVATNETELSYQNYIDSVVRVFKNHAKSIKTYRDNLEARSQDKQIYLAFFLDDTTILGNYALTERGKEEPLSVLCVKEFLDLLGMYPEVDFIISRSQIDYYRYKTIIFENLPEILSMQYEKVYDNGKIVLTSEKSSTIQSIGGESV